MADGPSPAEVVAFAKRSKLINLNMSLEDVLDQAAVVPVPRAAPGDEGADLTLLAFTRYVLVTD